MTRIVYSILGLALLQALPAAAATGRACTRARPSIEYTIRVMRVRLLGGGTIRRIRQPMPW